MPAAPRRDHAWLLLGAVAARPAGHGGDRGRSASPAAWSGRSATWRSPPSSSSAGDLPARAPVDGPPEIRQVSNGLNRLAERIGDLLAHERETLADLSHRLRTPLTALRIDAESLASDAEVMTRVIADVDTLTRTVNEIIDEAQAASARRRERGDLRRVPSCASRAAYWHALAEDQERWMTVELPPARCRSGWPIRTWPRAWTSCWRTCSRIRRTARRSRSGCRSAPRAAPGSWSRTTGRGSPSGLRLTRPVERRLHRPRAGYRPPHCRGIRRHAHPRPFAARGRRGDDRPWPVRAGAEGQQAAH